MSTWVESFSSLQWAALFGAMAVALQFILAAAVILRVVLTRHPPGSSLAWILLTLILPYVGFFLYLTFGEKPLGRWRAFRLKKVLEQWAGLSNMRPKLGPALPAEAPGKALITLAENLGDLAMSTRSKLTLMSDTDEILKQIATDIRAAQKSISMEFYIWEEGGLTDNICAALISAARRGVRCEVLLDDIGSHDFLAGDWPRRFREAGIDLSVALPVRFFGPLHGRADLRLHRKTVVIDDRIGYTGSLNMIDPKLFKQDLALGGWVDAMVRIEGEAVDDLKLVIAFDRALHPQNNAPLTTPGFTAAPVGSARVCTVPSGPSAAGDANLKLMLQAIYSAKQCIRITTPYFVPGDALLAALTAAAERGVDVRLCLPKKNDSLFVQLAGNRYFEELLAGGVKILLFAEGLLHTKAVTVDGEFALFGTVNLDNRSLHLNFEMMLLVFDPVFVSDLVALQATYEEKSRGVDKDVWRKRGLPRRLAEGFCALASPLL